MFLKGIMKQEIVSMALIKTDQLQNIDIDETYLQNFTFLLYRLKYIRDFIKFYNTDQ